MNITELAIYKKMFGGTGGGTSGATAYTVSSIDELPSNAVDGSMAIVEIIPKYYVSFSDDAVIPSELWGKSFYFDFYNYYGDKYHKFTEFYFWDDGGGISYYSDNNNIEDAYIVGEGWFTNTLILIVELPNDNTFIDWCNESSRGIQQNEGDLQTFSSLYTHENGQWVYKCEVV